MHFKVYNVILNCKKDKLVADTSCTFTFPFTSTTYTNFVELISITNLPREKESGNYYTNITHIQNNIWIFDLNKSSYDTFTHIFLNKM